MYIVLCLPPNKKQTTLKRNIILNSRVFPNILYETHQAMLKGNLARTFNVYVFLYISYTSAFLLNKHCTK